MNPNSEHFQALLQRMRDQSDFPALTESVTRIQNLATSETESISSVTNAILKDVALTNKLLRLVNSAHYARGSSVGTISRAVCLVGFNGIRNLTLSLVLLEHMHDKGNAQLLKEEFLRALLAGTIAAEWGGTRAQSEEAFIGALFQHLGRMLTQFYFPQEAMNIRRAVNDPDQPVSEAAAAIRALGVSFEELGVGVAREWGLPESIQHSMVAPIGEPPLLAVSDDAQHLRWSVRAAHDMSEALLQTDPERVDEQLYQIGKRYGKTLAIAPERVKSVALTARQKLVELADAMELTLPADSPMAHLLHQPAEPSGAVAAASHEATVLPGHALQASTEPAQPGQTGEHPATAARHDAAAQILAAGVQDITDVMVDDFKLGDVLRMILEAMWRALQFHRVIFCMRDPKTNALTGRFGLGEGVEAVVRAFQVPLNPQGVPDLFTTICSKGADTLINDTRDPRIAARLPAWYVKAYHAPGFLILPLVIKGQPVGLIYADRTEQDALRIDDQQLSLLRTLRNQAVMAFKQSA